MRIALLSMTTLVALANVAVADTPPCMPKVSPGQVKWTTCVPDELHAPSGPKTVSGMGLSVKK
ncbi:hypothetical protein SAMN05216376_10697 [Mameliella alba]|nr:MULTISPECIES: hypothetical protein [Mameliella]ODM47007.1 hypothetical protein A9320_06270 [Ruegeria sp. PBVC088]MDD9733587.1 hypothetical protein [Mameliella sp. AT18]PTR39807.1 hypothetical protein LX94_02181 [Mameliella alba]SDD11712.1 hypothetical protein SAMN05216376_10697 [Mameliella alba]GGF61348.1 hypothetical protein GCM10011319_23080 [Mameliella alba]